MPGFSQRLSRADRSVLHSVVAGRERWPGRVLSGTVAPTKGVPSSRGATADKVHKTAAPAVKSRGGNAYKARSHWYIRSTENMPRSWHRTLPSFMTCAPTAQRCSLHIAGAALRCRSPFGPMPGVSQRLSRADRSVLQSVVAGRERWPGRGGGTAVSFTVRADARVQSEAVPG